MQYLEAREPLLQRYSHIDYNVMYMAPVCLSVYRVREVLDGDSENEFLASLVGHIFKTSD